MKQLMATILMACAGFAFAATPEGWTDDYEAALKRAAEEKKNVLVDFTGSDWCGWCKKLDKEVFETEEFRKEAPGKYVLLYVDTPSKPSMLSEKARKQNPQLVEKYGIEGFPTILILDAAGRKLAELGYQKGGPAAFLKFVEETVRDAPDVEKYIKPIEDILNASDAEMKKEMQVLQETYLSKLTNTTENLSAAEKRKAFKEMSKAMQKALFDTVLPKYIPLYDKAFADAHAMSVPAHMEAKKNELINRQESNYKMMKMAYEAYQEKKSNPDTADDDDDGDEAEEDDEDESRGCARQMPRLIVPPPELAKTDEEYFRCVAEPFYNKNIVDVYDAASETNMVVREKTLVVRKALARNCALVTPEFPLASDKAAADWLWKHGSRDAAAAIVRFEGSDPDFKYWQGEKLFAEAMKVVDSKRDPLLRLLLARAAYRNIKKQHSRYPQHKPERLVKDAYVLFDAAFTNAIPLLSASDPRIAEWLDIDGGLPVGAGAKLGNSYLEHCQRAAACKDAAFASRGSGWAHEVTEEGWKGWTANNETAERELRAAYAERPEKARAPMMLADLFGRSCGSEKDDSDPFEWANRGISNSLDVAAIYASGFLHFQTARWGGGSRVLSSVVMSVATNVTTASSFSYRMAAYAVGKMLEYDNEGENRREVYSRVLTPELRKALYGMFDAYIAAGDEPCRLKADEIRQMGITVALLVGDWDTARAYRLAQTKGQADENEQFWCYTGLAREEKFFYHNLLMTIGSRKDAIALINAEQALAEGRYESAAAYYGKMAAEPRLSSWEKTVAFGREYLSRIRAQQAAGGWVDLMPTRDGTEAIGHYGWVKLQKDGWARLANDWRGVYMPLTCVPGIGKAFEATIRFEKGKPDQKEWHIGWGWARPYTCNANSWAFPAIHFIRDSKGDHVQIDAFTRENESKKDVPAKGENYGMSNTYRAYKGDIDSRDEHTFRASFGERDGMFTVDVDGRRIYELPMEEMLSIGYQNDRVQPNGEVFPLWKVYKSTAFTKYGYRPIKADSASEEKKSE